MFKDIDIENSWSLFSKQLEKAERALPWPDFYQNLYYTIKGEKRINWSKWERNWATRSNTIAVRDRLRDFFLAIEYFQGYLKLERTSGDLSEEYKNQFFLNVAADSLISSLDIIAKATSWFFNLRGKHNAGFNWSMIKQLTEKSKPIYEFSYKVYKSEAYERVKKLRNNEKHHGLNQPRHVKPNVKQFTKVEMRTPYDFPKDEKACVELFGNIKSLFELCVFEFDKFNGGLDCPGDYLFTADERGRLKAAGRIYG